MTSQPTDLNGPMLKTALGSLGLPPSWFAERMGVTMRTVVRWFDRQDLSQTVAEELVELLDVTTKAMQEMLRKAEQSNENPIVLLTYRTDEQMRGKSEYDGFPASWHRAVTLKAVEYLTLEGKSVKIEYA